MPRKTRPVLYINPASVRLLYGTLDDYEIDE